MSALRDKCPQVEFFSYDVVEPGNAESSEELNHGEYGTLAVLLEVGYTPFVAMLPPRGEEYFTVINHGDSEIDLSGFTLKAVDRKTGRPDDATAGIQMIGAVRLVHGQEASLRRTPDLVDAAGDQMVGIFAGGELLTVESGDQLSLLEDCRADVDTSSV